MVRLTIAEQERLIREYEAKPEIEDNAVEGPLFLEFVLELGRLHRGVTAPGPARDAVDRQTMEALAGSDILGPEHSLREGAFRRLVSNPSAALDYLESAVKQRNKAQSLRGQKPRPNRRDSITRLIEEILEEDRCLPAKEVGRRLAEHPDIQFVDDEYRHTGDASTLRVGNLASRVSDARGRVSGQPG